MPSYIVSINSFNFGPYTEKAALARDLEKLGFKKTVEDHWERGAKFQDYASVIEVMDKPKMAEMFPLKPV